MTKNPEKIKFSPFKGRIHAIDSVKDFCYTIHTGEQ